MPIDQQSDKPAFEALMYPGGLTPEIIAKVTKDMPPAFLLCGADDRENIAQHVAAAVYCDAEGGRFGGAARVCGRGAWVRDSAERARGGGGVAGGVGGVDGYEGISAEVARAAGKR